ncbi:MAG: hypothetical protein U5K28_03615 [Halobacteriales archaeon]|nr:hypothetical protein [Halobacteriales archaeon]
MSKQLSRAPRESRESHEPRDSATESPSEPELSYDSVFFVLSNPRRRYVLHYLKSCDEPISTGDLAARVAAWEYDVPYEQVTNQQRKRVYTSLHQTHLPKMASIGLLEYDPGRSTVQPDRGLSKVDFYLEVSPQQDIPWHIYYLGLATLSVSLVLAGWVGVFAFAGISGLAYAGVIALLLVVSAVYHVRAARRYRFGEGDLPPSLCQSRRD